MRAKITKSNQTALIVAQPGPLRDGLQVLLAAIPHLEVLDPVDNGLAALQSLGRRRPAILLLDLDLAADDALALLKRIKTSQPQLRCIVLADYRWQQQAAQAGGAEAALLKGIPAGKLFEVISAQVAQSLAETM